MARSALTVQVATVSGLNPVYSNANADGHSIAGGADVNLIVKNASGDAITVTLVTPSEAFGLALEDKTISVPATTGERIIKIPTGFPFSQTDGSVHVNFSAVTSVTVAAIR